VVLTSEFIVVIWSTMEGVTPALARLHHPEVAAVLAPLIESGLVATCGVIEFELGWVTRAARSSIRYELTATLAMSGWPPTMRTGDAVDVQAAMWHGGRTRPVGRPTC
jgi:hypothetical protein